MSVSKLLGALSPQEVIKKINEIIDNMGSGSSFSGSYDDLTGKPVLVGKSITDDNDNYLGEVFNNNNTNPINTATGNYSHAEGQATIASNTASHAEGRGTESSGECSHAEGSYTLALGEYSHVQGWSTIANGESQDVSGKYNIFDTTSAVIVGNGTSDTARSNAYTLDWNGNAYYAGTVNANIKENVQALTDGTAIIFDSSLGSIATLTVTQACTISFTSDSGDTLTLLLTNGGSQTVTWTNVKWAGGTAPTLTANGVDCITIINVGGVLYGVSAGGFA